MSNNQLRYIIMAGLFAVPFIPFVVSKSLLFPFISGKAFIFRTIVEVIFACWLVLILKAQEYRPKFSWILTSITLFLIVIGVADLFAVNPSKAFWSNFERMEGYLALLHFGMFFLVASSTLKGRETWNKLFATSVFASFMMAIYSFFQIAGKIVINQGGVRVDGTFGNATYLGIYMVFHIFLAGYLFLNSRSTSSKYLLGIVSILNLLVLYYTATRGAILGLLGGAVVTFLLFLFKSEKGDKIRKVALVSIGSIVLLIILFLAFRGTPAIKNNPVLGRFATLSFAELQTQGRYYVWPIAWKGTLENPILGWGQEGFNFVFNKFYNPKMYNQEPWFDRTHDIVLDWLVAGGLLGLLSYLSILLALFLTILKRSNLSWKEKSVFLGLLSAYCFHNLFVFDQIGSYILFFSVLAFVHSNSETPSPAWAGKISSKFNFLSSQGMLPVSSSVVVILLASGLYFWQWEPWQENKAIIKVLYSTSGGQVLPIEDYKAPLRKNILGFPEAIEHISNSVTQILQSPQADQKLKTDLFAVVDEAFKKQLSLAPTDARYRIFYGLFLSSAGDTNRALAEYQEALKYSPNKQTIQFEVGGLLLSLGKKAEALELFKKAYEAEPSYEEAKFMYGLVALSAGEETLSRDLLKDFDQSKIIYDDRYISVLASLGRFSEVINVLKQRIVENPVNTNYRLSLAAAYLQSNQRAMAVSTIRDIITIDPTFKEKGEYYISEIEAGRNP